MVYTVTVNPSLDYIMETDTLLYGQTNRSKSEKICFGGKGINVSFVLKELGIETVALGFICGHTGDQLASLVNEAGVRTDFIRLAGGSTRINVKLRTSVMTEINASGPYISEQDVEMLKKKLSALTDGDILVLSGRVPASAPKGLYSSLMACLDGKNVRVVVDTSGLELEECLAFNPWLVKPNQSELSELCKRSLDGLSDIEGGARELQKKGAKNVLVSLGSDGALLLTEDGKTEHRKAFKVNAVNTVGAGDSAVAGYIAGSEMGASEALRLACAAGAASTEVDGLATKNDIERVLSI